MPSLPRELLAVLVGFFHKCNFHLANKHSIIGSGNPVKRPFPLKPVSLPGLFGGLGKNSFSGLGILSLGVRTNQSCTEKSSMPIFLTKVSTSDRLFFENLFSFRIASAVSFEALARVAAFTAFMSISFVGRLKIKN
jgi:hypothetical protein